MNEFSLERVNQFVLEKHHLTPASKESDIVKVVKDICALHATGAPIPYLSLWNRVKDFKKEQLNEELYEKKTLLKLFCMRNTWHIVAVDQSPEFFKATLAPHGFEAQVKYLNKALEQSNLLARFTDRKLREIHRKILDILSKKGPLGARQITDLIPELQLRIPYSVDKPYAGHFRIGQRIISGMCFTGLLAQVNPKGSWKSRLYEYVPMKEWLPDLNLDSLNESEAKKRVVLHHLSSFGPATEEDVAWWIGLAKGETREILGVVNDQLERVRIQGLDGPFIVLRSDLDALERCESQEGQVNLLPNFDPYVMGYKNRLRFGPEENIKRAFFTRRTGGFVEATILVDGRIVGIWDYKEQKDATLIRLSLFEKVDRDVLAKINAEARALGKFISDKECKIC